MLHMCMHMLCNMHMHTVVHAYMYMYMCIVTTTVSRMRLYPDELEHSSTNPSCLCRMAIAAARWKLGFHIIVA